MSTFLHYVICNNSIVVADNVFTINNVLCESNKVATKHEVIDTTDKKKGLTLVTKKL